MDTKAILGALRQTVQQWDVEVPVLKLAAALYEQTDSATSLGLYLCLKYGDILSLVSHKVSPAHYLERDVYRFKMDYQCCSLLAKYPFSGVSDTRQAAIDASKESELSCSKANDRLGDWFEGRLFADPTVSAVMFAAKDRINQLLGDFDANEWLDGCRFGPGVSCGSRVTSAYDKLSEPLGINPAGLQLALASINSSPSWVASIHHARADLEGPLPQVKRLPLMDYGKRAYVPKNALTDRPIEIQPGMSAYLQLGIGEMIRKRLKRSGVDLDHGWKRNSELARRGSFDNRVATVDLKSASDSICYSLVNWIVPEQWLHAMTLCRPRFLLDEDRLVETERFSSMGNGYTFELESMIFYALAWSVTVITGGDRALLAIFGDDIAVDATSYPLLEEVFSFCGFTVNPRKTFVSGLFRESCGADWFMGHDVSPLRITRKAENVQDTIELANRIRRYAQLDGLKDYLDVRWRPMWLAVVMHLPRNIRQYLAGPPTEEHDQWLHSDQDSYLRNPLFRVRRDRGFDAPWVRVPQLLCRVVNRRDTVDSIVKCYVLYSKRHRERLHSEVSEITYRAPFSREQLARGSRLGITSNPGSPGDGSVSIPTLRTKVKTTMRCRWKPTVLTSLQVWL